MDKNYRKLDVFAGSTIENAVNQLLDYKNKGELVFIDFNGKSLYSDTVTMDNAYIEITGMTKAEFDEAERKRYESFVQQEEEHKAKIPELTKVWQEKGREVLTKDKWYFWDEIVPIRLNDLYRGMELNACLKIVKILNNGGTLDEAKAEIESQDHSGTSFGLVCAMVKEFSERGNDFVDYVR